MQGEQEIPPGHVSGTEAYRQNQARAAAEAAQPPVGTVVQQAPVVVQPAAVSVVQPVQQPVGQVVYQQQPQVVQPQVVYQPQQPVQPVGQVVYQQQQPPAVVVQQPTHAGPHQEKFIGIATISIPAMRSV